VRTERLDIAGLPPARSDDPTHTRAPVTPRDRAPSLAPVRVEGPRSPAGRPAVLFAIALFALVAFAYAIARGNATSAASSPAAAARRPVADRERSEASTVAALPNTAVGPAEPARVRASEKPRGPSSPEAESTERPASNGRSTRPPKLAPNASAYAAPTSSDERRTVPSNRAPAASTAPPPGLPGSGL
jgi:hypothetical protein